jgi:hypothetical protein
MAFKIPSRHTFFFFRSKLKHLCKYEEKKYRNKVLSELQAASDKNAKAFWDILNKYNSLFMKF